MKKRTRRHTQKTTYTQFDELMASPTEPIPKQKLIHHLSNIYQGLRAIEQDANPRKQDWIFVSDALNMLKTLVNDKVCEDPEGVLIEAMNYMCDAMDRATKEGKAIRLSGPGIASVRNAVACYADILEVIPARVIIHCHRKTEKEIQEVLKNPKKYHAMLES